MKRRLLLFLMCAFACWQANAALSSNFETNNYINEWGQLKLNGVQLSDKNGNAVQLRGWATSGYSFGDYTRIAFDQQSDFAAMKKFGANVVRLTCYVANNSITAGDWTNQQAWLKNAISWTNSLGMYCIVDYHVLTANGASGNPNDYLSTNTARQIATSFFSDISSFVKTSGYNHVLYEICNEPGNIDWNSIKTYANAVLPSIAANDPKAVVIVGTGMWSQKLTDAKNNQIFTQGTAYSGLQIMYTFHFYSCTHANLLNTEFTVANLASIPVFVTEWNDTQDTGDGNCGTPPSSTTTSYINLMNGGSNGNGQKVSWTSWKWDCNGYGVQTSNALRSTTNLNDFGATYNYTTNDLTATGKMVYDYLQKVSYATCPGASYQVTFYSDGGSAVTSQTVCSGQTAAKPTDPTKVNNVFAGWYNGNTPYTFTEAVNAAVTLTAHWTAGTGPTIVADCEKRETAVCTTWFSYTDENDANSPALISTITCAKDSFNAILMTDGTPTAPAAVGNGYISVGFDIKAVETVSYSNWGVGFGFNLNSKSTETTKEPVDLTGATSITFYHKGAQGSIQIATAQYTENFAADIPAHANWTQVTVPITDLQITYGTNQGKKITDLTKVLAIQFQISSGAAAKTGTFSIDQVQIDGMAMNLPTCETEEPPTPCANTYTVTFDSNGGTTVPAQTGICEGTTASRPAVPTKTGYTFGGWNNGPAVFDFATPITSDLTLTAQWSEVVGPLQTIIADCETDSTLLHSYWFGYDDGLGSTYTPPTSTDPNAADFPMYYGPDAYDGNGAMRVDYSLAGQGTTNPNYDIWGMGVGFNLNANKAPYDLSGSTGISFWIKSSAPIVVQIKTGDCQGDDNYSYETVPSTGGTWKEITLTWSQFLVPGWNTAMAGYAPANPDPSKIVAIQWQASAGATAQTGYFMLDDVTVEGVKLSLPDAGTVGVGGVESTSFAIYPNPTQTGNFTVALEGTAKVSVLNLQGQMVYYKAIEGTTTINANLTSGVYMVMVQSDNGVKTQKLIVK